MNATVQKIIRALAKFLAVFLIVFSAYLAYGLYAERSAERKANHICDSIKIGSSTAGLRERALKDGASDWQSKWVSMDGFDVIMITYTGLPPYSRYLCRVQTKNEKVLSAEVIHLD